jgi:hypothetical protein
MLSSVWLFTSAFLKSFLAAWPFLQRIAYYNRASLGL